MKLVRKDITSEGCRLGWVGLGWVRLETRMRRWSCARAWLMTSSLCHLAILKFRQDGITLYKELETARFFNYLWYNARTKLHQFPSSYSQAIKFVRTDISCEVGGFGWVRSGWVRLHAQKIMRKGEANDIIVAPRNFKVRLGWYYELGTACLLKLPMAQHPYKISSISAQLFCSYKIRTDKHLLLSRWIWLS
jgi:hypothetical protein